MTKTALISVYYKDDLEDFARGLVALGWDILSTGGTLKFLREKKIKATDVTEVTGFPEILDGRVKTLSPNVFAGILYKRDNEDHRHTIDDFGIRSIDMVVNILYPFEETIMDEKASLEEIIEKIDIGGPSMIRACAKNYKDTIIVTDKGQYKDVLEELKRSENASYSFRERLAKDAFVRTARYDIAIANYFQSEISPDDKNLLLAFEKERDLRYGENPHQEAKYYRSSLKPEGLGLAKVLQGKELSYNNMLDITAGLEFIKNFKDEPCVIGIKHTNPCSIAANEDIELAYDNCIKGDSESIFGGIIVLNRRVTKSLAEKMTSFFLEIIIAPAYSKEALDVFEKKKNLRIVALPSLEDDSRYDKELRFVSDGLLIQDKDLSLYKELKQVSEKKPSEKEMEDLLFAFKCVKCLKSNAVAIVKDKRTLGLGLGDVNRFFASSHALDMAGDDAKGAVVASDGFFPFKDSLEAFHKAGISSVIQPGGSIKDDEVISYANETGISMIFTEMRHFRH